MSLDLLQVWCSGGIPFISFCESSCFFLLDNSFESRRNLTDLLGSDRG
jgi:hypothetical protein